MNRRKCCFPILFKVEKSWLPNKIGLFPLFRIKMVFKDMEIVAGTAGTPVEPLSQE
jgi:hypothetical protein